MGSFKGKTRYEVYLIGFIAVLALLLLVSISWGLFSKWGMDSVTGYSVQGFRQDHTFRRVNPHIQLYHGPPIPFEAKSSLQFQYETSCAKGSTLSCSLVPLAKELALSHQVKTRKDLESFMAQNGYDSVEDLLATYQELGRVVAKVEI